MLSCVAIILIIMTSVLMYLYLFNRTKETIKIKDFFSFAYDKKVMILSIIVLGIALLTFLYSYYLVKSSFLRSFMNAEVSIWLTVLGYIDLKEKIIPNELILSGICFWLILSVFEVFLANTSLKQVLLFSLSGAGICGGVLFIIAIIVKSALGMGDVKMFFVIGLLYGLTNTYSILLFSIIIMAIISIVLLMLKKVTRKTAVPMAPFVALGFLINVFIGI